MTRRDRPLLNLRLSSVLAAKTSVLTPFVLALLLLLAIATEADAQVAVIVQNVDGSTATGRLEQLTAQQLILRSDSGVETLKTSGVLRLSFLADAPDSQPDADRQMTPDVSATPWLVTSTGDWLRVRPLMIDDTSVVSRWAAFPDEPSLTVPLEVCVGTVLALPDDPYRQGVVFASLFAANRTSDRAVLQNGDRIAGEFVGLQEGKLDLETTLGLTSADFDTVRQLAFNPELVSTPDTPDTRATVVLRDGSLLQLKTVLSNGGVLLGETLADASVSLPLALVAELHLFDENRVPVSSLPISSIELTPYLSVRRQPQINRNVLGGPQRVRGQSVATGIGVTSGTTLTFDRKNGFETLVGRVALDDAAADIGSVRFEILSGDRQLWQSDIVTVASGPVELPRLDVSQTEKLTLRVDIAERGSVRDIANWCDLVLLKSASDADTK